MTHGDSRPALAATIMTEDAKAEENTAGKPCGAYIESAQLVTLKITSWAFVLGFIKAQNTIK